MKILKLICLLLLSISACYCSAITKCTDPSDNPII